MLTKVSTVCLSQNRTSSGRNNAMRRRRELRDDLFFNLAKSCLTLPIEVLSD